MYTVHVGKKLSETMNDMMKDNKKLKNLAQQLNSTNEAVRFSSLKSIAIMVKNGEVCDVGRSGHINNHIHTKYSFSPYSPTMAVWKAYNSGLSVAGIVDHDTVSGAKEFVEAGKIVGIPTTVGFEIRTLWDNTRLAGKRLNNPNQLSCAYITAHGLAQSQVEKAKRYLRPIQEARNIRNEKMVENINSIFGEHDIHVDYYLDVLHNSLYKRGGSVTERHILFALTKKILEKLKNDDELIGFLQNELKIKLSDKQKKYLCDTDNTFKQYDLLNLLKAYYEDEIYIDAEVSEAPMVEDAVAFIKSVGAIPCYCYLGDVKNSITDDKSDMQFEDSFLEELIAECRDIGFNAITYAPSRNTKEQLTRIKKLCDKYEFIQISGEDINQPRQSFVCQKLMREEFAHLHDTTWAIMGNEIATNENINNAMFNNINKKDMKKLKERIAYYKNIAKMHYANIKLDSI